MAQIGGAVKVKWANFARGYNSVRQPQDLTVEELAEVMNYRYVSTPYGVGLTNRPGLVKVTGTTAITTAAVKDLCKYVDSTGKVFYLAACNSKLYSSTLGTSTTFGSVGDLGSTRGRMVNFAGRCVIADGAAMKYFVSTGGTDAGTFGTCTGSPPSATMVVVHGDRLIANDITATKRNAIAYCNVRDPEDWTTSGAAGNIYISEFTEVTALNKFYGIVLVHGSGPKNVMKLSGTTPTDFAMERAIPGAAAVGPDQSITLTNDVLFFDVPGLVSFQAWERFGDIEQSIRSDPVSNLVIPYVSTSGVVGRNPIDTQLLFYDGTNTYILVYDAQFGIWTKYWFSLGTSVTPTCFADLDGQLYIGTSDGHVWRMDTTEAIWQDNSVDYDLYWKSGAADFDTILKKHGKYFNAQVSASAGASASAVLYKDLSPAPLVTESLAAAPERIISTMTDTDTATGDTVTLATYSVEEAAGVFSRKPINFEFKYVQAGMINCDPNNSRMDVNEIALDGTQLSRA